MEISIIPYLVLASLVCAGVVGVGKPPGVAKKESAELEKFYLEVLGGGYGEIGYDGSLKFLEWSF